MTCIADDRSNVDRKVKPIEKTLFPFLSLLRFHIIKLLRSKRHHVRFDAARAESHHKESEEGHPGRVCDV